MLPEADMPMSKNICRPSALIAAARAMAGFTGGSEPQGSGWLEGGSASAQPHADKIRAAKTSVYLRAIRGNSNIA